MMKRGIIGISLLLVLFGSGCRLTYILHAAAGQYRLIHRSIDVEKALRGDLLGPDHKDRLRLVASIKDFGEKELGLSVTGNYQTVYLESRQPPIYIVSASPKDRLTRVTWWFPIVGMMPYLGFFDLEGAREKRTELEGKNLDVNIGMAVAYSTLGWFEDPVTLNLLEGSAVDLIETILHEMTHTTLYATGQGEFNEGLANLLGKVGAISFTEKTYGPFHPHTLEAKKNLDDERTFSSFLSSFLDRLELLYNSPAGFQEKLKERERVFVFALQEFAHIRDMLQTDRYTGFGSRGLNNAYLMSISLYNQHFHLFEELLERKDGSIREMLSFFHAFRQNDTDMLAETRSWLNRTSLP